MTYSSEFFWNSLPLSLLRCLFFCTISQWELFNSTEISDLSPRILHFFCYKMKLFGAIVIHRHFSHIILVYWYRILMNRRHFEWHSVHNIFSAPSSCSVFIHIQFYISQNINSFFLIHENLERKKASVSPACLLICFFFYFYNWKTSTQQL